MRIKPRSESLLFESGNYISTLKALSTSCTFENVTYAKNVYKNKLNQLH